ncbi:NBR1-Ig-like domain-containing protein [Nucisporomicrobium flavum]|uniref:NBR1-Ig-like domain-containing protein n=1 Tax=Nucisporomicrobium flavum TaxID=2785915 RepID=UPI0018F5656B|nr:NBR1-Ig-like domain-containing protein [Nucisporomicrobium flavum]
MSISAIFAGISATAGQIKGIVEVIHLVNRPRSVIIEVDNNTDLTLTRSGDHFEHGDYAETPAHLLGPKAAMVFGGVSRANSVFTGVEGHVDWAAGPVTMRVHFDNPFIGANSGRVELLGPQAHRFVAFATIGAGDTEAKMRYELFRSGADVVSQVSPPARVEPGSTSPVQVTMKNTSNQAWTAQAAYALGAQAPQDNSHWGNGRVALPHDVAPGDEVTFAFDAHTPAAPGVYAFQWRMVQDGVTWFGDFSPQVLVQVGEPVTDPGDNPKWGNKESLREKLAVHLEGTHWLGASRSWAVPAGLVARAAIPDGEASPFTEPAERTDG